MGLATRKFKKDVGRASRPPVWELQASAEWQRPQGRPVTLNFEP
jgi:hypothetical protein